MTTRTANSVLGASFGLVLAVTVAMAIFGLASSPFVILYLPAAVAVTWIGSRLHGLALLALVGVGYAGALALEGEPAGLAWWPLVLGTLAIAAQLTRRLASRSRILAAALNEAVRTDSLTGLLNRVSFEYELDLELERARRSARPVGLMVADFDHFRNVNDVRGYHAGDAALERFASILAEELRRIDAKARIGGEEFALMLPGTDEAGAYMLAERLRVIVSETFEDESAPLTISFGIASYPAHGYQVDALLKAADHALYTAKALGRDRTVICNPAIASAISMESEPLRASPQGRAAA